MSKWLHKVNIEQYLTEDESWEGMIFAANNIAKELNTLPEHFFEDFSFSDNVGFLSGLCMEDSSVYASEQELLSEINYCLHCIYDFADAERIWLGE